MLIFKGIWMHTECILAWFSKEFECISGASMRKAFQSQRNLIPKCIQNSSKAIGKSSQNWLNSKQTQWKTIANACKIHSKTPPCIIIWEKESRRHYYQEERGGTFREYFYSVIFEISDKQMQFTELKNTPKQKKNWYFDNFDKSKSRNTASGSWFVQKYGL